MEREKSLSKLCCVTDVGFVFFYCSIKLELSEHDRALLCNFFHHCQNIQSVNSFTVSMTALRKQHLLFLNWPFMTKAWHSPKCGKETRQAKLLVVTCSLFGRWQKIVRVTTIPYQHSFVCMLIGPNMVTEKFMAGGSSHQ